MKAFQLIKKGDSNQAFKLTDLNLADPKTGEVQIEVEAFGLNYADVMARQGLYRDAPPMPCVIGYEVVGKVCRVGDENNKDLIGSRVLAFTRFGGYSQLVNTSVLAITQIENMDAGVALSLATQYVTAYYMCEYLLNIHQEDKVLVHSAAGGVGTALIQLLKLKGAYVIAKTGSDEKIDYLNEQGADLVINYRKKEYQEEVLKFTNNEKIDVSFNPVAGSTFKKDLSILSSGGRIVLFGGSERSGKKWGVFSTLNFLRKMGLVIPVGLMMGSKNILGVNMLKIADNKPLVLQKCMQELIKLAKDNQISPHVGASFKSEELAKAHDLLESGKSIGKIIVLWK